MLPFLLTAFLMTQNPVDLDDMRVKTATKAREMTIGRQASRRFERRAKLIKDATVHEYVDGIAQNVAHNSDCEVPVTVKIVDSNEINAFSFPGGFLYINSGLILAVDDVGRMGGEDAADDHLVSLRINCRARRRRAEHRVTARRSRALQLHAHILDLGEKF